MMISHPLIILRGNSGCGKTSTGALTPASTRLRHDVGVTGCGAPGNAARER